MESRVGQEVEGVGIGGGQVEEGDESRRRPGDGGEVDKGGPGVEGGSSNLAGRLPPSPKTRECSS